MHGHEHNYHHDIEHVHDPVEYEPILSISGHFVVNVRLNRSCIEKIIFAVSPEQFSQTLIFITLMVEIITILEKFLIVSTADRQ